MILKAEKNKNLRRFTLSKRSFISRKSDYKAKKNIEFKLTKVKENVYEFIFDDNLDKGEYAIIPSIERDLSQGAIFKIYNFSIK